MDMHDVLEKLKKLEKSPEQEQAVKSTEALMQPPKSTAEAPVLAPEKPVADINTTAQNISASGEGLFKEYEQFAQQTQPSDIAQLAGTGTEGSTVD